MIRNAPAENTNGLIFSVPSNIPALYKMTRRRIMQTPKEVNNSFFVFCEFRYNFISFSMAFISSGLNFIDFY